MNYRLLVLDIDGTLLGRNGNISAEDREAVSNVCRTGIGVSLSTGRVTRACLDIIKQLSLDGYHIFFDGALVYNPEQDKEVYVEPLDSSVVGETIEFARQKDIYIELYSANHYFVERDTWGTDIHRQFFALEPTVKDLTQVLNKEKIIKVELMTSTPEEVVKANSFYLHFQDRLHFSRVRTPAYPGVEFINVTNPQVSKGKALVALTAHLGIPLAEVMAIGDGTNDIPILTSAGLAVAMDNAPDEVKAVAHHITLDVDHSGLAAAVKKYLLY